MSDNFFSGKIESNKDFLAKLQGLSVSKSGDESSKETSDVFSSEFSDALNNLSNLENTDKLREDAISNAKAILKNWAPPTDAQIDKIIFNMRKELMA